MDGQLRLTAEGTGTEPIVLAVDVPPELLERLSGLTSTERMEYEVRAPVVLAELVSRIAYQRELTDLEVQFALTDAQRDANRLALEHATRIDAQRCPECGVHAKNGHLLTCESGRG